MGKQQSIKWFILIATILAHDTCIVQTIQTDPIEQMVRSSLLTARWFIEKALSEVELPRSDTLVPGVQYSLQLDDKTSVVLRSLYEFVDTCPICQTVPISMLAGEWQIILASRNFLISVIADLTKTIDRIEAGLPISVTKSLDSILVSDPDLQCAEITIVGGKGSSTSPIQIVYSSQQKRRSIIGRVLNQRDKYVFEFAPTVAVELCLMMTSLLAHNDSNDALIFAQSDAFPPCSNFIVLVKNREHFNVLPYLQYITRNGGNFLSNPLIDIRCSHLGDWNQTDT